MKKLINNKWQLHTGLCIIALILFIHFTTKFPNFLQIGETGIFLQSFLGVLICLFVAGAVEWIQGKYFGSQATNELAKISFYDIIASEVGGAIGIVFALVFPTIAINSVIPLLVIILIIEYKRVKK